MLLWIVRGIFLITILGAATSLASESTRPGGGGAEGWLTPVGAFLGALLVGLVVIAADVFTTDKQITTLSAVYFGMLLGLLLGHLISMALEPLVKVDKTTNLMFPLRILITVSFCYICVSTLFQTKDDFRFLIPYVEFSKQIKGGRPLVLDTSVIIDGRIADICETKIIDTKLVVPRFVLQELQAVADSPDKLKRNRGRRGLDILKRMQNSSKVDLVIHEGNLPELREVTAIDDKVVMLAKSLGARIITNDYNQNKAAQLQGVDVININELANSLKTVALPGEIITVRLIKPGDQIGQGVGYLDDGTMVVAEQGRASIGQEVNITVTSILQTPAGRMIFGRVEPRTGTHAALSPSAAAAQQSETKH
jgi:uncharacterized protein YacL